MMKQEFFSSYISGRKKGGSYNSGRESFEGDTFYSYSTPVARYYKHPDRTVVIFITTRKYSISTQAHKRNLTRSIPTDWIQIGSCELSSYGDDELKLAEKSLIESVAELEGYMKKFRMSNKYPFMDCMENIQLLLEHYGKQLRKSAKAQPESELAQTLKKYRSLKKKAEPLNYALSMKN